MKRAFAMPLDGVSCVAIDDEGEVRCQRVGCKTTEIGSDAIIVYQKGLIPPKRAERSYRSTLSSFLITTPAGRARVPWSHFAWVPEPDSRFLAGDGDDLMQCVSIFEMLTVKHVFVVWAHGAGGEHIYEWYVAFKDKREGNDHILTHVPHQYLQAIVENSGIAAMCRCGRCERHPLLGMMHTCKTHSADVFEKRAIRYFLEYSKQLCGYRARCRKGVVPDFLALETAQMPHSRPGTCAICLEDKVVGTPCVHEACKLAVCAECHTKTRGLCAVCDRSKNSSPYVCMTCDRLCGLEDFGFECPRCNKRTLCRECDKNFEFCVQCSCDIASGAKGKRARR